MPADILCLGEPMVEFNQQPDGRYLQGHGGDTSNCAIAAARQGASVGYLTHIGQDVFGRSLLDLWAREGVDTSCVVSRSDAPTGIYFVTHGEDGHEFSYRRAGSAASLMRPEHLPVKALESCRILHVSGISQAISPSAADTVFAAISAVKSHGGIVSYDTNLRLKLWPLERAKAIIHAAVAQCDIALPGLDDASQLTGLDDPDDIVDFYLGLGVGVVALTLGDAGVLVGTPDERRHILSHKVRAVDATGAGDTFDGAFLARFIECQNPFEAATHANAAASLAVQGYGAVAPMPDRAAVIEALQDAI
jgi:2-dehydro-3-deoxygluconokinase